MSHSVRAWARWFPLLAFLTLLVACKGSQQPPADLFGDVQSTLGEGELEPEDLAPYLTLARSSLSGSEAKPDGKLEARSGRRVFLLVHREGADPIVSTGLGTSLERSVVAAATQARPKVTDLEQVRLQLDVVTAVEPDRFRKEISPEPEEIGIHGYLMASGSDRPAFVLPGDIIWKDLYLGGKKKQLDRKRMLKIMARRAGVKDKALEGPAFRFETRSVVEAAPGGPLLPLYRGMVERDPELTPEELLESVRLAADYLVRIMDEQGRYMYKYEASEDKDGGGYNMLRHCGTTYALLEAYEELKDPRYLEAAERALTFLFERLHPRPDHVAIRPEVGDFIHLIDEEKGNQSKVGGAGLAVIALSKHAAITGKADHLERMRGLARFIHHMQEENGHFISYFQYRKDVPETQKEVLYYPGEAMLGLLRLYALDPDPTYIAIARRGADYLINVRDQKRTEQDIEHDHWLSMALNELYRVTKHAPYAEHAFKIARAIMRKQKAADDAPAPDFIGTFYKIPNSTPASTRLEAFAADITLSRFMGRPDDALVDSARPVASFIESQQFDAANSFFLPNPARAIGGVRESILHNDIQIDYVQHALSGMLGLARALRDPAYGKTGVPGVLPVTPLEGASPLRERTGR